MQQGPNVCSTSFRHLSFRCRTAEELKMDCPPYGLTVSQSIESFDNDDAVREGRYSPTCIFRRRIMASYRSPFFSFFLWRKPDPHAPMSTTMITLARSTLNCLFGLSSSIAVRDKVSKPRNREQQQQQQ